MRVMDLFRKYSRRLRVDEANATVVIEHDGVMGFWDRLPPRLTLGLLVTRLTSVTRVRRSFLGFAHRGLSRTRVTRVIASPGRNPQAAWTMGMRGACATRPTDEAWR